MFNRIGRLAIAILLAGLISPALAGDPSPGHHLSMPSHGFHAAPPGFHGPHIGRPLPHPGPWHHFGNFHGHDFAHLTVVERDHWRHGGWHHTWHHGHYGWWWYVDDLWFFYPAPIYPYPTYVGPNDYYDWSSDFDTENSWYYCQDPQGYYPYVQQCNGPWQPVPPTPTP